MMHTIRLNIQDSVFDKVIYFLQNLPKNEVEIIEDKKTSSALQDDENNLYTTHSVNLIEDWKDESEDAIWK